MKSAMLLAKLPMLNISRKIGKPLCMPVSYTFSVNSACDCNCKTCNISSRPDNHMSLEEWEKALDSIGTAPYWITVTGGNQFLRKDFGELLELMVSKCKPKIINIPVNGTMPDKVYSVISSIVKHDVQVNVNLSIDGIGKEHDKIRGKEGNFELLMETYEKLRLIKAKNLQVGFYTVASRFNLDKLADISAYVASLEPDRHGIEPASNRQELLNMDTQLQDNPPLGLIKHVRKSKDSGSVQSRLSLQNYLNNDKVIMDDKEIIPCYAGLASVHISHDGEVWQCVTRAETMGNLRENNYDFRKILNSSKAAKIRRDIKKEGCYCTHSNPAYTNQLCTPKALLRLLR